MRPATFEPQQIIEAGLALLQLMLMYAYISINCILAAKT